MIELSDLVDIPEPRRATQTIADNGEGRCFQHNLLIAQPSEYWEIACALHVNLQNWCGFSPAAQC